MIAKQITKLLTVTMKGKKIDLRLEREGFPPVDPLHFSIQAKLSQLCGHCQKIMVGGVIKNNAMQVPRRSVIGLNACNPIGWR